ncbi:hypothetical protein MMC30_008460 [Trapelia coarctata]|nr:hypothetical protein [Trapelia coarctata]
MKPQVQPIDGLLQLRYKLPYCIHKALVYPLLSPNGSTIIVCGHDQGVLVIWRGGRPFKPVPKAKSAKPRLNGNSYDNETPMDVDEAEPQPPDQPVFEDEEEELDPKRPYHPIIQDVNLPTGAAVLKIAFPQLPQLLQHDMELTPGVLQQNLVVALGCADSTVRILTLPLVPPSPESKARQELRNNPSAGDAGHGNWGEQSVTLPSASGQRSLPTDISIAFMPHSMLPSSEDMMEDDEGDELPNANAVEDGVDDGWDVLVAYCGSDQPTDFTVHRIPLSADGLHIEADSTVRGALWKTGPTPNPVVAVDLYVPTNSDSEQDPYLLLAEANGAMRIFECSASSETSNCQLIRSFHPGFETVSDGISRPRRVLDAKFVLGGQAVVVLTADGEWGVWNISIQKLGKLDQIEKGLSINGGIPTKFNLSGWIGGASSVSNTVKSSSGKLDSRSKLAPMTPGTRKVRQEALFTGAGTGPSRSEFGGIFVRSCGKYVSGRNADDTVVFWHGDKTVMIPSLSTHWQNKIKGSGSLFGDANGQVRVLTGADLGGELRSPVSIFPSLQQTSGTGRLSKQPDILITGDRSILILSPPLYEEPKDLRQYGPTVLADQQLLTQGDLDVGSIDRILDSMANGTHRNGNHTGGTAAKRRVGFTS